MIINIVKSKHKLQKVHWQSQWFKETRKGNKISICRLLGNASIFNIVTFVKSKHKYNSLLAKLLQCHSIQQDLQ